MLCIKTLYALMITHSSIHNAFQTINVILKIVYLAIKIQIALHCKVLMNACNTKVNATPVMILIKFYKTFNVLTNVMKVMNLISILMKLQQCVLVNAT